MDGHNPTKAMGWLAFHQTHVPHTRIDDLSKRTREDHRVGTAAVRPVSGEATVQTQTEKKD
jgi:hypothetical protein